ncbi:hypothetical protein OG897_29125 [Streptomyces sp. NBC_00237]|uniref:hypothetical protein n=1 Tax=Streptomyces sp. NBC_00237 TaxID=2975687 RepID=UPI0022574ECC|nr:hypothetical protein [Streptomyces sp. NBC_00237]MCX5205509.1 hypothetical protein [Streptomyces sp. NBC_00237]
MPRVISPRRGVIASSVAVVLLAGCTSEPPPLEFGTAKPSGPRLDAQPPKGGSLPLAQWPDACAVLLEEEIRAILPQAKDFERDPIKVSVLNFNPLATSAPGTTGDVPKGGCETEFGLPAKYVSKQNSRITIVFQGLADPALVAEGYAKDRAYEVKHGTKGAEKFQDLGASLGPTGCFTKAPGALVCHQGPYEFEVDGSSTADGVGEYTESRKNWREKVLVPVVRTLSARMPAGS